jgi:hypothetical protein
VENQEKSTNNIRQVKQSYRLMSFGSYPVKIQHRFNVIHFAKQATNGLVPSTKQMGKFHKPTPKDITNKSYKLKSDRWNEPYQNASCGKLEPQILMYDCRLSLYSFQQIGCNLMPIISLLPC